MTTTDVGGAEGFLGPRFAKQLHLPFVSDGADGSEEVAA